MFVCVKPRVDAAVAIGQEIFFIARWEKLLMRVALLASLLLLIQFFLPFQLTHTHVTSWQQDRAWFREA